MIVPNIDSHTKRRSKIKRIIRKFKPLTVKEATWLTAVFEAFNGMLESYATRRVGSLQFHINVETKFSGKEQIAQEAVQQALIAFSSQVFGLKLEDDEDDDDDDDDDAVYCPLHDTFFDKHNNPICSIKELRGARPQASESVRSRSDEDETEAICEEEILDAEEVNGESRPGSYEHIRNFLKQQVRYYLGLSTNNKLQNGRVLIERKIQHDVLPIVTQSEHDEYAYGMRDKYAYGANESDLAVPEKTKRSVWKDFWATFAEKHLDKSKKRLRQSEYFLSHPKQGILILEEIFYHEFLKLKKKDQDLLRRNIQLKIGPKKLTEIRVAKKLVQQQLIKEKKPCDAEAIKARLAQDAPDCETYIQNAIQEGRYTQRGFDKEHDSLRSKLRRLNDRLDINCEKELLRKFGDSYFAEELLTPQRPPSKPTPAEQ